MNCDEQGKVAICTNGCGQVFSPYWSASKSKYLHERGMGHKVKVMHASDIFRATRRKETAC
jgi:hypothetical protein